MPNSGTYALLRGSLSRTTEPPQKKGTSLMKGLRVKQTVALRRNGPILVVVSPVELLSTSLGQRPEHGQFKLGRKIKNVSKATCSVPDEEG